MTEQTKEAPKPWEVLQHSFPKLNETKKLLQSDCTCTSTSFGKDLLITGSAMGVCV